MTNKNNKVMKANEAPEKLYIPFEDEIDRDCLNTYAQKDTYPKEIEYTRTDAFIEKACKFFAPYIQDNSGGYDRAKVIEDFRKHMEE